MGEVKKADDPKVRGKNLWGDRLKGRRPNTPRFAIGEQQNTSKSALRRKSESSCHKRKTIVDSDEVTCALLT